jgi:hypothetical protein
MQHGYFIETREHLFSNQLFIPAKGTGSAASFDFDVPFFSSKCTRLLVVSQFFVDVFNRRLLPAK